MKNNLFQRLGLLAGLLCFAFVLLSATNPQQNNAATIAVGLLFLMTGIAFTGAKIITLFVFNWSSSRSSGVSAIVAGGAGAMTGLASLGQLHLTDATIIVCLQLLLVLYWFRTRGP